MKVRGVARRLVNDAAGFVLTFLVVTFLTFALVRLLPYSPVPLAVLAGGVGTSRSGVQAQVAFYYGLYPSGPLYAQFLGYLWAIFHGNFGHSIVTGQPVASLISESLPWTLLIVTPSIVLSFTIGTLLGMLMAYRRSTKLDVLGTEVSTVSYSLPVYVVGIAFLILFSFSWGLLPHAGAYNPIYQPGFNYPFVSSVFTHAVLPIVSLTLVSFGSWALSMRGNTIAILGEDYITSAEARGIRTFKTATSYVGRNAILPQFTYLVLALGFSLAGSVFIEEIFTYPGMGYQLLTAIEYNDYPVIMGIFITYVLVVLIGLILTDLIYGVLDPRVRK